MVRSGEGPWAVAPGSRGSAWWFAGQQLAGGPFVAHGEDMLRKAEMGEGGGAMSTSTSTSTRTSTSTSTYRIL